MKMMGSSGYNFIEYIPFPSRCRVFLRSTKIEPAERAIPNESRNIVKLRIFLKSLAKKSTIIQTAAKTVREVTKTSFFADLNLKTEGSTPSSLIAYITRGLLINKTFTYASTERNKSP